MKDLLDKYVGRTGEIKIGGLTMDVEVLDVKVSYGRERYEVRPVAGKGLIWVEQVNLIDN